MALANQETCPHPFKRHERVAYGRSRCARCGADLTPPGRTFEIRHSERVTLAHGDRVAVNGQHAAGPFQGVFLWAETFESGLAYCIAELQQWRHEGKLREDWAAHRWVRPEYVRQAPGVRDRKNREEAT